MIHERISSLMVPSRQSALRTHKQRSVSAASRLSEMLVESTTSDILDVKLAAIKSPTQWRCVVLDESKKENIIGTFGGSYMKLKVSIAKARVKYYINDIIGD